MKKEIIITGLIITAYIGFNTIMSIQHDKQLKQEAQAYKECIYKQSEEQGWIIRSTCSQNYKQLDQIANITYTQKGYDLYLNK